MSHWQSYHKWCQNFTISHLLCSTVSISKGAKPIDKQENPAAWVLRAFAGEDTPKDVDWAELYKSSDEAAAMRNRIQTIRASSDLSKKLTFGSTFSTPMSERVRLQCARMLRIYRRSSSYNLLRLAVAILYAFLLGSIYLSASSSHTKLEEAEAEGLIGTIFLSLNVIGTTAMTM